MYPQIEHERRLEEVDDVAAVVAAAAWPDQGAPDTFGLEVEAFPFLVRGGRPVRRSLIEETGVILNGITESVSAEAGGHFSFEPGGQLEYSTAPSTNTGALWNSMEAAWTPAAEAMWQRRVCLVGLGFDPFIPVEQVPQQLPAGRYLAMDDYFGRRGGRGHRMMRHTCSIQVNLDAGIATRRTRWFAANLISPLLTAMFSSSPGPGVHSRRARIWQEIDPTRTGFPPWRTPDSADPVADVTRLALAADVMFIDRGAIVEAQPPGFTFGSWLASGHPRAGRPTAGDLVLHLSTLFTEVRPRHNVLELRASDALPRSWWPVPVVIAGGLVYGALEQVIDFLGDHAPHLDDLWGLAAERGLADQTLYGMAAEITDMALAAAARRPDRFAADHVRLATEFADRFTYRGRAPADELLPLLASPAAALAWAAPEHAFTRGST